MNFPAYSDEQRKLQVNWELVATHVARWKPKTFFDISITRKQKRDSDPLRGYYFSTVLRIFAENQGYDRHDEKLFHHQLKAIFFQIKPDKLGVYRDVPHVFHKEKSELDVPRKRQFVSWVKRFAAEQGCYIPDPGEPA
ncbi:MAG: hypothetical protein GY841_15930 [FCB group bacterium]|nr:hypothetical protein [FCB group bacterium]